jgi:beta-glucanase (GH16 family)
MKKVLFTVLLGFSVFSGFAPAAGAESATPASDGWKLVFSEEFDGQQLDKSKWTVYRDCWGGGNQERQCYTGRPENISVHDGVLELNARLETATGPSLSAELRQPGVEPPPVTKPFTSGKISTKGKFSFTYGRVEVRAKLPVGQGVWPAIWLLPDQFVYGEWPGSGEIDVMEAVNIGIHCADCPGGIQNNVYGTIHYGSVLHHQWQQKAAQLPKGTEADWHTYTIDWAPERIKWYLDGREYNEIKLSNWRDKLQKNASQIAPSVLNAPFDRPFYLLLNFAVGGQWPEGHDLGGVVLTNFPKTFAVDWVHIYRCSGTLTKTGDCSS